MHAATVARGKSATRPFQPCCGHKAAAGYACCPRRGRNNTKHFMAHHGRAGQGRVRGAWMASPHLFCSSFRTATLSLGNGFKQVSSVGSLQPFRSTPWPGCKPSSPNPSSGQRSVPAFDKLLQVEAAALENKREHGLGPTTFRLDAVHNRRKRLHPPPSLAPGHAMLPSRQPPGPLTLFMNRRRSR